MTRFVWIVVLACCTSSRAVELDPADTVPGYLGRLLINEIPFPGESGWVSEKDSRNGMLSVLWVLHARIRHVPAGYSREELAATRSENIVDVITAGGVRGQCDGFYREADGSFAAVDRVHRRVAYLLEIANKGQPGRFASLIQYAQGLAAAYVAGGIEEADRYVHLRRVGSVRVTGRAYSWMTGRDYYHPGGDFVKIPDADRGLTGGNRFFTLKERKP